MDKTHPKQVECLVIKCTNLQCRFMVKGKKRDTWHDQRLWKQEIGSQRHAGRECQHVLKND